MGRVWCSRISIISTLGETIGYKSGLALSSEEMLDHLPEHSDIWDGDYDDIIGLRSEVFAEMVAFLLHRLGNIPSPDYMFPGVPLSRKYRDKPEDLDLLSDIVAIFAKAQGDIAWVREQTGETPNLDPIMGLILRKYGSGKPIKMALEFLEFIQMSAHIDPWSDIRHVEWQDSAELSDLFESESLQTLYGRFFDQRYIDYIDRNFGSIDSINWRKFEGLTAEYFDREGFIVEIGPGRDDGGIDVRIWPQDGSTTSPPTILVQCKRQKNKVEKVVVKALWADVVAEGAKSGLIVTSSALSPGARKTSIARAYPLIEADRDTVREWVQKMRSPGAGVFLGE